MQEATPYTPMVYRDLPAPYGLTEPVTLTPFAQDSLNPNVAGSASLYGLTLTSMAKRCC